jgi:hypothetical protein
MLSKEGAFPVVYLTGDSADAWRSQGVPAFFCESSEGGKRLALNRLAKLASRSVRRKPADSSRTPTLLRALFREFLGAYHAPCPISDFDYPDVALDTAMNYLECTGQAEKFIAVRRVAVTAIATGA